MGRFEEILVIVLIALILFGSSKLPDVAKNLRKALDEFRKSASGEDEKKDEKGNDKKDS